MASTTWFAPPAAFRHEALLYEGEAAFVDATVPFLTSGVAGDEAMLVVVSARKIDLLKSQLGPDAGSVAFTDMNDVGLKRSLAQRRVRESQEVLAVVPLRHADPGI
jgi:hypothetical protein